MTSWERFEHEAPELAAVAHRLWPGIVALQRGGDRPPGQPWFAIAYLATVRRNGGPRLHPFCPILAVGDLYAAIPASSPKAWDLRRDGRAAIHALPGADDDELCIRATAVQVGVEDAGRAAVQRVVEMSDVGGMIRSVADAALFRFDLERVDVATWLDIGQAGTRAVRHRWTA